MRAPCCVIVAYDAQFRGLPRKLFSARDMRAVCAGHELLINETVKRSSTLRGAYVMLAAHAGADCGQMSGSNALRSTARRRICMRAIRG